MADYGRPYSKNNYDDMRVPKPVPKLRRKPKKVHPQQRQGPHRPLLPRLVRRLKPQRQSPHLPQNLRRQYGRQVYPRLPQMRVVVAEPLGRDG